MSVGFINSKDNALIKTIKRLQTSSRQRKKENCFVIEGLRLLDDAADNNIVFSHLLYTEEFAKKNAESLRKFTEISEKVFVISEKLFASISDTLTPQGVLAVAKIKEKNIADIGVFGKYIALENLQDPSNVGAICRTAESLGLNGVFVSADSCDIYSPKVLRSSMGTVLRLPIYVLDNLPQQLKETNLTIYACVVHGDAEYVGNFSFNKGSVAVIGNEGNGLTDEMIKLSNKKITIKMNGRAESLNAAAAASIVMWEMCK